MWILFLRFLRMRILFFENFADADFVLKFLRMRCGFFCETFADYVDFRS